MFKTRLLTALLLLPLLLLAFFKLTPVHLNYLALTVIVLAILEWAKMLNLSKLFTIVICGLFVAFCLKFHFTKIDYLLIFKLSTIFWFAVFLLLLKFPKYNAIWRLPKAQVLYIVPLFVPAYIAFSYLNITFGSIWLLFGLSLIFIADSGAYVFGKLFGARKMAPNISPGKTIMGLYGAIFSGIVLAIIFAYCTNNNHYAWMSVLGLITVLFSVNGDLAQSALKRVHGIKDSGTLIPGHGGVFDRLDSIIGALPVFALLSNYLLKNNLINSGLF